MEQSPKRDDLSRESAPHKELRVFLGLSALSVAVGLGMLNLYLATADLHQLKKTVEGVLEIGKAEEIHYHLFTLLLCFNAMGTGIFGGMSYLLLVSRNESSE